MPIMLTDIVDCTCIEQYFDNSYFYTSYIRVGE